MDEMEKSRNNLCIEQLAKDILFVQPMEPTLFKDLLSESKDKDWLVENGYKPVSRIGLLYVKDNKDG